MPDNQEPPTSHVIDMLKQGYTQEQIKSSLQSLGYTQSLIGEAINQAAVKSSVENIEVPPAPSPTMQQSILTEHEYTPPVSRPSTFSSSAPDREIQEQIQEIVESVIEEKWQRVLEDIGNLSSWKDKVKTDILSIKQEILRIETRFENLVNAVTGKLRDYDKGVENVGTDIKALEKVLQQIISPLSTNVRELSRITETLKKTKK